MNSVIEQLSVFPEIKVTITLKTPQDLLCLLGNVAMAPADVADNLQGVKDGVSLPKGTETDQLHAQLSMIAQGLGLKN